MTHVLTSNVIVHVETKIVSFFKDKKINGLNFILSVQGKKI